MAIEVRRTPIAYEAYADGRPVGALTYSRRGDVITALHTEVSREAKGQGVGGTLARTLLDDARAAGHRVEAQCPFVAGWIERHPAYAEIRVS